MLKFLQYSVLLARVLVLFISFMPEWDFFVNSHVFELLVTILAMDKMLQVLEESTILFLLVLLLELKLAPMYVPQTTLEPQMF